MLTSRDKTDLVALAKLPDLTAVVQLLDLGGATDVAEADKDLRYRGPGGAFLELLGKSRTEMEVLDLDLKPKDLKELKNLLAPANRVSDGLECCGVDDLCEKMRQGRRGCCV